jgi:predicted GNAT family N-acyltransferase
MSEFDVTRIGTLEELADALEIRRRVFIEEQQVPEDEEIDHFDGDPTEASDVIHVLARLGGEPVATGRLLLDDPPSERAHIGRVAVLAERRGAGAGRAVMEALQAEARGLGRPGITLAAQMHAIPFYERLGYVARGAVFLDAGIEHRWMDLDFV